MKGTRYLGRDSGKRCFCALLHATRQGMVTWQTNRPQWYGFGFTNRFGAAAYRVSIGTDNFGGRFLSFEFLNDKVANLCIYASPDQHKVLEWAIKKSLDNRQTAV